MSVDACASDSSRPTNSLRRRTAYTLAAGAVAVGATSDAQAQITYSGPQNISIGQFNFQNLNLDGDAFNDIRLKNYVFGGGNYQGATVSFYPGKLVGFVNALGYVSALDERAPIRPSTLGPNFAGSMAYGANNPSAEFNNVTDAYLGLSFPSGATTYYGWIRVDVNNAAGTFLIKDWAYAEGGIVAGNIPEPGTLGILAAGALGVAALRRQRRQAD